MDESPGEPSGPYAAFGFQFRLTGPLAPRVAPLFAGMALQRGSREAHEARLDSDSGRHALSIDDQHVFETDDLGALVHQLTFEITQRSIDTRPSAVLLHAATVLIDDVAIVISGQSGSGKSSLATALTARGAAYVTDEVTAVDASGSVVGGLVRPVHLSRRSVGLLRPTPSDADVTMPGGGRYMLPARHRQQVDAARTVVVLLGDRGGDLRVGTPRRADAIAHLVRERFASGPIEATLRTLKNVSIGAGLVTVSGGSIMQRAYLAETLATQEIVIAPA